ncbi:MAG: helix-turn-helix transcriptional regulator [Clostridia bacterium]
MDELEFKKIVADNLTYYRKQSELTQLELAEKLNYSDKSVSKWERGDGLPDLYVLNQIADILEISVSDIVTKHHRMSAKKLSKSKYFVTVLSCALVWLVAVTTFVFLTIFDAPIQNKWLCFVYAVPVCAVIILILSSVWGNKHVWAISTSILIWSCVAAVCLTLYNIDKIWWIFLIAFPLQILTILWFFFRRLLKKEKSDE